MGAAWRKAKTVLPRGQVTLPSAPVGRIVFVRGARIGRWGRRLGVTALSMAAGVAAVEGIAAVRVHRLRAERAPLDGRLYTEIRGQGDPPGPDRAQGHLRPRPSGRHHAADARPRPRGGGRRPGRRDRGRASLLLVPRSEGDRSGDRCPYRRERTRARSWALIATITVESDIRTAPRAGERRIPALYRTPAASGMAMTL